MYTVLASVFDKTNLVDLLNKIKPVAAKAGGLKVVATGTTCGFLKDAGFDCVKVEEMTGFPEILEGRVKTLHPKVFAGILSRANDADRATLKEHGITEIDLVIVNLYPFAEKMKLNLGLDKLIEYIDIGGVSLLRAAGKNYDRVSVLGTPDDYQAFAKAYEAGQVDKAFRLKLAARVFQLTAAYDALIEQVLSAPEGEVNANFPQAMSFNLKQVTSLRYGENPHQAAAWYQPPQLDNEGDVQFPPFEQLAGKELSANNIVDCYALVRILRDVRMATSSKSEAACIIKHNNPCGVAIGKTTEEAFDRAYGTDPLSAFGGIYGFSGKVTASLASKIVQGFVEIVAAPEFEEEALKIFNSKKNMRVLKLKPELLAGKDGKSSANLVRIKDMGDFGLILEKDVEKAVSVAEFETACGDKNITTDLSDDLAFAWNVVKHLTSNAIVVVKDGNAVGFGIGQTSRVASVKLALTQGGDLCHGAILASDAFFPSIDSIEQCGDAGIKVIIQPGGSIKDKDVIARASELGITMLLTGQRCFRH
ncbi:MAG: bifunctional phosphoribosylaminoimidazolecarboxamide formyltransferase/IMP cyclohydrolase [Candidatus Obscuribacter sp.]|jgi:phosphoribosylaminoimidazolecarboxamide formyltransferase/IMP cyclohydrolase|nr:bifunctional phosphoribosylaminoimidazolecarboxamide formyltransferase/IMP cyclohydrolase [Candidatus Obscuribacter sp.]MBK9201587.1 bifunctional phosphoribosylaminoimidazolecarboxamide formyltransferase/IMP cyclohydrolase [Candidatus Obscuribacter sp.]MBK9619887.1 bifunctional phosphoribosylaminoimidazolecarboxamide formyltransferase/IMP cyclohydrolase [Candidatus Obscuribacter sp.]MBP6351126.1 bifunctional phosphoribosylaminoimidazolecarboxamide formyltransferase/IMP cyclohydrolase [Candida